MQTSFTIHPQGQDHYQLEIGFANNMAETNTFRKVSFFTECEPVQNTVWDICTKNGHTQSCNIFNKKDTKAVKKAVELLPDDRPPTILTLDLKDKLEGYSASCKEEIRLKENQIITSMKTKKVFKDHIDFMLHEGSLKADLLQAGLFSEKECAFLNSPAGAMPFCQIAEYFMNGFKLGACAKIHGVVFSAKQYITPVSERFSEFLPVKQSIVLYPEEYQKLYSQESPFARSLEPAFVVEGDYFAESGITKICVEKRT